LLANPKDGEQRIFLGDFGIARNVGDISGLTATNMIVGTLPYAAPEQLMDDPIDGRADEAFRRKPTDASERYYPVPALEVFKALNEVVPQLFNLKSSDDFTLCCTFTGDLQGVEFTRDPKYVAVRAFVTAITVISTNVARLQLPGTSGGGLPPRRIHGEAQCWCDATQIEIPHCGDVGGRAGHCGRTHGGRTAISDLHKPEHIGDDMRLARQCGDQRLAFSR
jgi:hypothetical protein